MCVVVRLRPLRLADRPVMPGVTGHLRQVRHANDLVRLPERRQLLAQHVAEPAADVGVDLVEDQRAQLVVARQHGLQCQHRPRQLAARRHLAQRPGRLAGIGRQGQLQLIDAPGAGTSPAVGSSPSATRLQHGPETGLGHAQVGQLPLRLVRQLLRHLVPLLAQLGRRAPQLLPGRVQLLADPAKVVLLLLEVSFPARRGRHGRRSARRVGLRYFASRRRRS